MKPGIVLTSLTVSAPSAPTKKSTRASPWQSSARNARTAIARSRSVTSSSSLAGMSSSPRRRGTWSRSRTSRAQSASMRISAGSDASTRPSGNSSTPHSTSRPTSIASTSTLGSIARAVAIAASRSAQSVTLVMPVDEPARAGLTNTGSPSRSRWSSVRVAVAAVQHLVGTDRQTLGREQLLGELLVHRHGAGQHAGARVGQADHFEQALDGAVLAVGAVQHREHHVDGGEDLALPAALQHDQVRGRSGRRAGSARCRR